MIAKKTPRNPKVNSWCIWCFVAVCNKQIDEFLFLRFYLFIFRKRGREGEKEREIALCGCLLCAPPTGDLAHNPGMCPNWESNWWPFGSQASTQSTELHQPVHEFLINKEMWGKNKFFVPFILFYLIHQLYKGNPVFGSLCKINSRPGTSQKSVLQKVLYIFKYDPLSKHTVLILM